MSKHFHKDVLAVLRDLPADRSIGGIPDANGFIVCRGERASEGFGFLERLEEGDLVGVLCQKK